MLEFTINTCTPTLQKCLVVHILQTINRTPSHLKKREHTNYLAQVKNKVSYSASLFIISLALPVGQNLQVFTCASICFETSFRLDKDGECVLVLRTSSYISEKHNEEKKCACKCAYVCLSIKEQTSIVHILLDHSPCQKTPPTQKATKWFGKTLTPSNI